MNKKRIFYTEAAYFIGILLLAVGTAFIEMGDFGMGAIVAPAYILHLKLSQYSQFFTFGVCEYLFQGILILGIMVFLKRARLSYLFSFVTAMFYGITLDAVMTVLGGIRPDSFGLRVVSFGFGMMVCGIGVAFLLRTYLAPEAYELVVKEVSDSCKLDVGTVKTVYDISSCLLSIILSFAFIGFGHFYGIRIGTAVSAVINGLLVGGSGKLLDSLFEFNDRLNLRDYFNR